MAIKVYGVSTYNGQRVTLALLEFGIEDFELVKVDLAAKEHLTSDFLTLQPFGQIPVFECGDFRLYESRAIVRFIAEKFKDQGPASFLGRTLEEQALVNQWVEIEGRQFNDVAFHPWSMEYYWAYKQKRPVNEQLLAPLYARIEKFFDCVETQLLKSKYLAGDFYSMADLNISPSLRRVMMLQPQLITTRKHVKAWYNDITSRPMFKRMLEADAAWEFVMAPSQLSNRLALIPKAPRSPN